MKGLFNNFYGFIQSINNIGFLLETRKRHFGVSKNEKDLRAFHSL